MDPGLTYVLIKFSEFGLYSVVLYSTVYSVSFNSESSHSKLVFFNSPKTSLNLLYLFTAKHEDRYKSEKFYLT